MAIVSQAVAQSMKQGAELPIMQPPAPVPSEGRATTGACKWYERGVYTDAQGTLYEVPIGCASNTALLWGLGAAVALAGWFLYRRAK